MPLSGPPGIFPPQLRLEYMKILLAGFVDPVISCGFGKLYSIDRKQKRQGRGGPCLVQLLRRLSFKLDFPEAVAPGFISRLRISKHLCRKLRETIDKHVATEDRDCCKVKIRNSRFSHGENATLFLCDFFEKIEPQSYDFNDCLDFALLFLEELKDDKAIYPALMAKKRFYLRSLQIAKQLETQLQKNNLETLLSQGKRVLVVDQADARKKMLIIDRISRAIFGKTEYFEDLHHDGGNIELRSDQDIQDIIKTLS